MNVGSRRFGNLSLKVEGFCCGAGLISCDKIRFKV